MGTLLDNLLRGFSDHLPYSILMGILLDNLLRGFLDHLPYSILMDTLLGNLLREASWIIFPILFLFFSVFEVVWTSGGLRIFAKFCAKIHLVYLFTFNIFFLRSIFFSAIS